MLDVHISAPLIVQMLLILFNIKNCVRGIHLKLYSSALYDIAFQMMVCMLTF